MNHLRAVLIVVACAAFARESSASPLCLPPAAPDAGIQRSVPADCLFYMGWNGAGRAVSKSQNATDQLLAESEIQAFVSQCDAYITALVEHSLRDKPSGAATANHLTVLVKTALTRPAALYVSKFEFAPPRNVDPAARRTKLDELAGLDLRAGMVVNAGDRLPAFAKAIGHLESLLQSGLPPGAKIEEITVGPVKLRRLPLPPSVPAVVWGFKGTYFLLSIGGDAGRDLVGRLTSRGAPPDWLAKLERQASIERPGTTWHVNVPGLLQIAERFQVAPPAVFDALGLRTVSALGGVSGFDKAGMVRKTFINTQGEPAGTLALLAGKPLATRDLQPIPKAATFAAAARLDLADVLRRVREGVAQINPGAGQQLEQFLSQLESQVGFNIGDDLFAGLGDVWCGFSTESGGPTPLGNLAVTVTVRDKKRLDTAYQSLVKLLHGVAEQSGGAWSVKQSSYRGTQVYYVPMQRDQAQTDPALGQQKLESLTGAITPCWCLTDERLIVSLNPSGLKAFLARDTAAESLAARPEVARWFKAGGGPTVISFRDTPAMLRSSYPGLKALRPVVSALLAGQGPGAPFPELPSLEVLERHAQPSVSVVTKTAAGLLLEGHQTVPLVNGPSAPVAGIGVALLLPAVQAAREAARHNLSLNNLKQIGLAMQNFADVHRAKVDGTGGFPALPAAATCDKQGKPLLSWRVQLLPYLEEIELYKSFHLDEPWDSEHNKTLIARMPAVYRNPNLPPTNEGKTTYLAVLGPRAALDEKRNRPFKEISDGSSNTILVVEANADRAVVWTKPDDWTPDEDDPMKGLRGLRPGIFLVLFVDGSARAISETADISLFQAMLTRDGGEAVNLGAER